MDKQWHCSLKELVQALCPAPFLSGSNTISCGGHGFRDYTHALRVGSQRLTGADADLYLVAEILAEVSGADALRATDGLTRLWRVLVLVGIEGAILYCERIDSRATAGMAPIVAGVVVNVMFQTQGR